MAKKKRKKMRDGVKRRPWTDEEMRALRAHSRGRTEVVKIAKLFKRTPGALRQQAVKLGIALGHVR